MKRVVLFLLIMLVGVTSAVAQKLPGDSARLLPILQTEINTHWPQLTPREFPAGVIDQESNWKATATLRTSRELGCGLGQFTIAYTATKSVRFDALTETKALHPSLAAWDWRDCQAVQYQLRAVVLKLKSNERDCIVQMLDNKNAKSCSAAKYNGGAGSVAKRIRMCRAVPGCNPKIWEGHLNTQCAQSKVKVHGYGESFCDINSKYPGRVFARMPKFSPFMVQAPTPVLETNPLARDVLKLK